MKIDHLAIWTNQIEELKNFYTGWFDGLASALYVNAPKNYQSYFLSFVSGGARLEIMQKPDVPDNLNDRTHSQHTGLIHLAFLLPDCHAVDRLADAMKSAGLLILDGPRRTGDGYYEYVTTDPDGNRVEVTANAVA